MLFLPNQKPSLTLLLNRNPSKAIGGDRIKNQALIKILSKFFKINLVIMTFEKDRDLSQIEKYIESSKWFQLSLRHMILMPFKAILKNLPFQVALYFDQNYHDQITQLSQNSDVVLATLIRMAPYFSSNQNKKFIDLADSIGLNYLRAYRKRKFPWNLIYFWEGTRLLKYEKQIFSHYDKVFFFNDKEAQSFQNDKAVVLPHGVNQNLLDRELPLNQSSQSLGDIYFLGKLDYAPNYEAVIWFYENVLPILPKQYTFHVLGANPPPILQNLKHHQLVVHGFVEDPWTMMQNSLAVVAPMQTGAGIQNKVLEALALGCSVVMSPLAALPLGEFEKDSTFLIADKPQDYIESLNRLSIDVSLKERIQRNARTHINKNHSWQCYEDALIKVFKEQKVEI